ncbi:hypothetical protein P153DRAFT_423965 [Dothidotthia symphoricarpi CBS 119687]|uniref:F-box domain-containing protein n=1 Tax=Dothidotthia symphoricarpi CBS 119687 TaxID=1392245 RepID=A0A6A6AAV8_9PLEO|nr:uncharacterized protein P153DRAFT_423965 [Dothidotthia symphoricarpi CBS 119687]KAF2127997.1 hypothetical protein P153DRAFT_423965 [Dothidotthia symphoricarpi CBS 119687]
MARLMSPEEHQELGRRYFKLKDYDKAAESFTQGIVISPSVSLYDHRAACYDRLKDLNAAVKDGREMIKLDKKDVKGYLRTASVLEKMDKPDTALGIYKYGMKNIAIGDKNFKLLQQLHDKLTRKLSPPMAIDPFTILPVELVEMILAYLPFRNVVNCMRVSRGWRDYLAKLSRVWMHLDLSGARKSVPRSFVDKAVRRSEYRLTRITVDRFEHMDVLKNIARACKSLADVEFLALPGHVSASLIDIVQLAPNLKRFVMHPDISLDTATQILHHRPTLEHFEIRSILRRRYTGTWKGPFPNLHTLSLTQQVDGGTDLSLASLISLTPALQSLTLTVVPTIQELPSLLTTSLTTLTLKHLRAGPFPILPPTLRRLVLEYTNTQPSAPLLTNASLSRLPSLTHLTLSGIDKLGPDFFPLLLDTYQDPSSGETHTLETTSPLHTLALRIHPATHTNLLPTLLASSPRLLTPTLHTLDLATLPLTDDDVEALLRFPVSGLHSLDVSHTRISGAAIKMLVDGLPGLRVVRADMCVGITGRDALGYAEARGVRVSWRMGEGAGGRRVRY